MSIIHANCIAQCAKEMDVSCCSLETISGSIRSLLGCIEHRFGRKPLTDLINDLVAENLRHSEHSFKVMIETIFGMLEARDPYTAMHQKRVALISAGISDGLGLDPHRSLGIALASVVHDVGKIKVPHELLSKPSKVTPAELEVLKEHPEIGRKLLEPIRFPWPVAETAFQHHERIDGSGYPRGLKGDDIILEAKIVAVADVVEAITGHRPYRPALGMDAALQEINSKAGEHYCPDIVGAATDWCRAQHARQH